METRTKGWECCAGSSLARGEGCDTPFQPAVRSAGNKRCWNCWNYSSSNINMETMEWTPRCSKENLQLMENPSWREFSWMRRLQSTMREVGTPESDKAAPRTSLKLSKADKMISWPPRTRQTAARSSRIRAFVLWGKQRETLRAST